MFQLLRMDWFYAANGQQVGPIAETQLEELRRLGAINDATLVWREGLAGWQPLSSVRAAAVPGGIGGVSGSAPGVTAAQCVECQRVFPQGEMLLLNRSWVCANCKPIFVQRMKEGVGPVGGMLWRYKKQLVVRPETPLPDRCVKCNAPANGSRLRRRLYWHHWGVYFLLLVNLLIYAVVAIIVRKRANLEIGLCETHRKRRIIIVAGSWLTALAGIGMMVYGFSATNAGAFAGIGALVFLTALIVGVVAGPQVAAAKIDKEFVWVRGVCREYLAELPEWNGP